MLKTCLNHLGWKKDIIIFEEKSENLTIFTACPTQAHYIQRTEDNRRLQGAYASSFFLDV